MRSDSTSHSDRGKASTKKPKDLLLSIHKGTGYWCRKVKGRIFYFGKVADAPKGTAALEEWLAAASPGASASKPQESW